MKKIVATFLGMSLLAAAYAQDLKLQGKEAQPDVENLHQLEIGSELPARDIRMKDVVGGEEVIFEKIKKENGLLVMFSCNTCPFVIKSQERTREIAAHAQKYKIGMIIVNSNEAQRGEADSHEAMVRYAKEQQYNVPYVIDEGSKVADMFGATRTPEVFLFNGEGKLMYHGAMEDNPSSPKESQEFYLSNAIEIMTSGGTPEPSFTKSIGCTIKRKG